MTFLQIDLGQGKTDYVSADSTYMIVLNFS